MRAFVESLMPKSILGLLQMRQETQALSKLETRVCDPSNLRARIPDLDRHDLSTEWESVLSELNRLQIGDRAGAVNPGDRRAIYYLARGLEARSILEVGTHLGASTSMLAMALRNSNIPDPSVVTVDIRDVNAPDGAWSRLGSIRPKSILESLKCGFVEFVTAPSVSYLEACKRRFDLIFLDGGHEASTVYSEVPSALRCLNPNGLILLHDFYPNGKPLWSDLNVVVGPWLAMQRFQREGAKISVKPLGSLPWITKLDSNVTSLACVIASGS